MNYPADCNSWQNLSTFPIRQSKWDIKSDLEDFGEDWVQVEMKDWKNLVLTIGRKCVSLKHEQQKKTTQTKSVM